MRIPLGAGTVTALLLLRSSVAVADEPATDGSTEAQLDEPSMPEGGECGTCVPGDRRTDAVAPRSFDIGPFVLGTPVSLAETASFVSSFVADADGNEYSAAPAFDFRARIGARLSSERELAPIRLFGEYEHDVVTGIHHGGLDADYAIISVDAPAARGTEDQLRKAYGQLDITEHVHLLGGRMTSSWGLGLVANDGVSTWEPGSARFVDPRGGDRLLRGMLMVGPFTDQAFMVAGGYDVAKHDDALRPGDEATQVFGALTWGFRQPSTAGVYVVARWQEAPSDGDETNVIVIDATGGHTFEFGEADELRIEGEFAAITGTTTFGSSPDFPEHDVRQYGAIGRLSWSRPSGGIVIDGVYASGDDNAEDHVQAGFRADPNSELGLVLFRTVVAAMSARAPITASDPGLVGLPNEDLDRLTTRGQVTNTLAFFPRGWWRPVDQLEIYGGPLIALAPADYADPFHTRIAGGDPRNPLNGVPGGYLGTEIDLGVRWRADALGTRFDIGAEGGVFLPGSAFEDAEGETMDPVMGGRFFVGYSL